ILSPCQNNVSHEQPFAFQKYLKRILCVTCSYLILSFSKHDIMRTPHCELWGIKRIGALSRNEVRFGESHMLRLRVSSQYRKSRPVSPSYWNSALWGLAPKRLFCMSLHC